MVPTYCAVIHKWVSHIADPVHEGNNRPMTCWRSSSCLFLSPPPWKIFSFDYIGPFISSFVLYFRGIHHSRANTKTNHRMWRCHVKQSRAERSMSPLPATPNSMRGNCLFIRAGVLCGDEGLEQCRDVFRDMSFLRSFVARSVIPFNIQPFSLRHYIGSLDTTRAVDGQELAVSSSSSSGAAIFRGWWFATRTIPSIRPSVWVRWQQPQSMSSSAARV